MAAFYDPRPIFRKDDDTPAAGGFLIFTDPLTDLAKDVYSDATFDTSLGNTIELDSAGRTPTSIHLDGDYNVELQDADEVQIYLAENINPQSDAGASLPNPSTFADGSLLGSDGVDWVEVVPSFVPDATGQSGKYLGNDGEIAQWTAFAAEDALPTIDGTAGASGSLVVDGIMFQWGTDTAPTVSGLSTTKEVTFGTAFSGTPYFVVPIPNLSSGVTSNSPSGYPTPRFSSPSTTGFTAGFFVGEENTGGTDVINATIPFAWFAVGPAPA